MRGSTSEWHRHTSRVMLDGRGLGANLVLDIPRPHLSSGQRPPTAPGDILPVKLALPEASVQDPDETIGQRSQRLIVGLASSPLQIVVATSPRRFREARERPEEARVEQPPVAGETGKDDPPGTRGLGDR